MAVPTMDNWQRQTSTIEVLIKPYIEKAWHGSLITADSAFCRWEYRNSELNIRWVSTLFQVLPFHALYIQNWFKFHFPSRLSFSVVSFLYPSISMNPALFGGGEVVQRQDWDYKITWRLLGVLWNLQVGIWRVQLKHPSSLLKDVYLSFYPWQVL